MTGNGQARLTGGPAFNEGVQLGPRLIPVCNPPLTYGLELAATRCPGVKGSTWYLHRVRPIGEDYLKVNGSLIPPFPWHELQWFWQECIYNRPQSRIDNQLRCSLSWSSKMCAASLR